MPSNTKRTMARDDQAPRRSRQPNRQPRRTGRDVDEIHNHYHGDARRATTSHQSHPTRLSPTYAEDPTAIVQDWVRLQDRALRIAPSTGASVERGRSQSGGSCRAHFGGETTNGADPPRSWCERPKCAASRRTSPLLPDRLATEALTITSGSPQAAATPESTARRRRSSGQRPTPSARGVGALRGCRRNQTRRPEIGSTRSRTGRSTTCSSRTEDTRRHPLQALRRVTKPIAEVHIRVRPPQHQWLVQRSRSAVLPSMAQYHCVIGYRAPGPDRFR